MMAAADVDAVVTSGISNQQASSEADSELLQESHLRSCKKTPHTTDANADSYINDNKNSKCKMNDPEDGRKRDEVKKKETKSDDVNMNESVTSSKQTQQKRKTNNKENNISPKNAGKMNSSSGSRTVDEEASLATGTKNASTAPTATGKAQPNLKVFDGKNFVEAPPPKTNAWAKKMTSHAATSTVETDHNSKTGTVTINVVFASDLLTSKQEAGKELDNILSKPTQAVLPLAQTEEMQCSSIVQQSNAVSKAEHDEELIKAVEENNNRLQSTKPTAHVDNGLSNTADYSMKSAGANSDVGRSWADVTGLGKNEKLSAKTASALQHETKTKSGIGKSCSLEANNSRVTEKSTKKVVVNDQVPSLSKNLNGGQSAWKSLPADAQSETLSKDCEAANSAKFESGEECKDKAKTAIKSPKNVEFIAPASNKSGGVLDVLSSPVIQSKWSECVVPDDILHHKRGESEGTFSKTNESGAWNKSKEFPKSHQKNKRSGSKGQYLNDSANWPELNKDLIETSDKDEQLVSHGPLEASSTVQTTSAAAEIRIHETVANGASKPAVTRQLVPGNNGVPSSESGGDDSFVHDHSKGTRKKGLKQRWKQLPIELPKTEHKRPSRQTASSELKDGGRGSGREGERGGREVGRERREGGREGIRGEREGAREGHREGGKEGHKEGDREGDREGGREGHREGGREGHREGGREGHRQGGREGHRQERESVRERGVKDDSSKGEVKSDRSERSESRREDRENRRIRDSKDGQGGRTVNLPFSSGSVRKGREPGEKTVNHHATTGIEGDQPVDSSPGKNISKSDARHDHQGDGDFGRGGTGSWRDNSRGTGYRGNRRVPVRGGGSRRGGGFAYTDQELYRHSYVPSWIGGGCQYYDMPVYYDSMTVASQTSEIFYPASPVYYEPSAVKEQLKTQIEYYFCEENLKHDFFLRRKMDKDGWIPIQLIAQFKRVAALGVDLTQIVQSMKASEVVETSKDELAMRCRIDPCRWTVDGIDPNQFSTLKPTAVVFIPKLISQLSPSTAMAVIASSDERTERTQSDGLISKSFVVDNSSSRTDGLSSETTSRSFDQCNTQQVPLTSEQTSETSQDQTSSQKPVNITRLACSIDNSKTSSALTENNRHCATVPLENIHESVGKSHVVADEGGKTSEH